MNNENSWRVVIAGDPDPTVLYIPASDENEAIDTAISIYLDTQCDDGQCGAVSLKILSCETTLDAELT